MKTRRFRPALAAAVSLSLWSAAALPTSFGWDSAGQQQPSRPGDPKDGPHRQLATAALAARLSHLTLDDAVDLALHRNPNIIRQLQEIQRTQGVLVEVFSNILPHIVAAGTFTQEDRSLLQSSSGSSGGKGISGIPLLQPAPTEANQTPVDLNSILNQILGASGGATTGTGTGTTGTGGTGTSAAGGLLGGGFNTPDKNYNVTIEVQQTLYNAAVPAQIRQAAFLRNAAYYTLRETVDTVVNTVKTDFYTVLLDQALIKINDENLRLLESQLQDQQNRFAAGTVPRFDVLQASVAVANQRPAVIAANNNYSLAYIGLARDLGLVYGPEEQRVAPLKLIGNLDYHPQDFSAEAGVLSAKAERALLKQQRLSILSEVEAIRIAAAGYQPTLTVDGGIEQRNSERNQNFLDDVRGWFWGANFNWNIFDGFGSYGRVKQARALLAEAKASYDDSVRQVVEEVQVNFDNLQQYKQTIQSQVLTVSEAEEAVRLSQARLSAGAGTQLDVLQSQVALIQAQTTELQARYNYAVTLANYERVTATSTVYPESFDDPMVRRHAETGKATNPTGVSATGQKLAPSTVKTPDTQRHGSGKPEVRKIDVDKPNMRVRDHAVATPDEPPLEVH